VSFRDEVKFPSAAQWVVKCKRKLHPHSEIFLLHHYKILGLASRFLVALKKHDLVIRWHRTPVFGNSSESGISKISIFSLNDQINERVSKFENLTRILRGTTTDEIQSSVILIPRLLCVWSESTLCFGDVDGFFGIYIAVSGASTHSGSTHCEPLSDVWISLTVAHNVKLGFPLCIHEMHHGFPCREIQAVRATNGTRSPVWGNNRFELGPSSCFYY
jgi:hypothetical protein